MNRKELLQYLIDKFGYEQYLEIGVHKGKTFLPIVCRKKRAVDPAFRIHPMFLLQSILQNRHNLRNRYYQMSSEKFFSKKLPRFNTKDYPDLVLIDGLHTFRASLKDVLYALYYLKPGGTIILHDCFPPNKAAAIPAKSLEEAANKNIEGWTGTWCGDVWKTIIYLKEAFPDDLDICVLNTDMGLGIVRKKSDGKEFGFNEKLYNKIGNFQYEYLIEDPEIKIGLTNLDDLTEIFEYNLNNQDSF